jgi:Aspartyl protease
MHRIALLAPAFAILSLSVVASRPTQTTSLAPAVVSPVTIPFELVTRHIMIPVKINNSRPLSFVLDTGDKFGIVDTACAKELGLNLAGQIKVGGAGSETMDGSFVQGANWMLPGLAGFSQPVVLAIPLDKLATRFGHDFDGIHRFRLHQTVCD